MRVRQGPEVVSDGKVTGAEGRVRRDSLSPARSLRVGVVPRVCAVLCGLAVVAVALGAAVGMETGGDGAGRDGPNAASDEAVQKPAVLSALAPRTLNLAVVDLDRVFEQSEEWQDHVEQRRQRMETMRRTLSHYDRQIRMLRADYQNMPPGTDAASEKLQEIEAAVREFGTTRDGFEQELSEQHATALGGMFDKIGALIEAYAKENGIDLVLKKQEMRVSSAEPAELGIIVATTEVLYASDEFDVTDVIVRQLNAHWGQGLILSP